MGVSYFKFYMKTLITSDYYEVFFVIICIPLHFFITRILKLKFDNNYFLSYVYSVFFAFLVFYPITNYCSRNIVSKTYRVPLLNYYFLKGTYNVNFEFKDEPFTRYIKKVDVDDVNNYEVVLVLRESFKDFFIIDKLFLERKNKYHCCFTDSIHN